MKMLIDLKPSIGTIQSLMYLQFQFMDWSPDAMKTQDDRFGSEPFGYALAYDNSQIIGVINLHKRIISFKGKNVLLGGVGGVCVHEDYRKRGIATELIKLSMQELERQECDVAFLCTDTTKLGEFYHRLGFILLNRNYISQGRYSRKEYKDFGGMIAPINSKTILEEILNDEEVFDLQGQDW